MTSSERCIFYIEGERPISSANSLNRWFSYDSGGACPVPHLRKSSFPNVFLYRERRLCRQIAEPGHLCSVELIAGHLEPGTLFLDRWSDQTLKPGSTAKYRGRISGADRKTKRIRISGSGPHPKLETVDLLQLASNYLQEIFFLSGARQLKYQKSNTGLGTISSPETEPRALSTLCKPSAPEPHPQPSTTDSTESLQIQTHVCAL